MQQYWFESFRSQKIATLWHAVPQYFRTIRSFYHYLLYKKKQRGIAHIAKIILLNPRACWHNTKHVIQKKPRTNLINSLHRLIIFAGVPLGDVGGGQRSAQLARCAALSGIEVIYVYLYPAYDFNQQRYHVPDIHMPGIQQIHLDDLQLASLIQKQLTALFELPHPKLIPYLEELNQHQTNTIYELIDDWDSSLGNGWFSHEVHQQFINKAQRVIATTTDLKEKIQGLGRQDVELLANAANEFIFNKYSSYTQPKEYKDSTYIGLCVGSLYGEWFSWDYIIHSAQTNPHIDFFIIGSCKEHPPLPCNVILLGQRNIADVPPYIAHATFTFIPFLPSNIIAATSPIKVFEYLFMQKPVITTPIPDIMSYPGVENSSRF